jgi:hypothetical protein
VSLELFDTAMGVVYKDSLTLTAGNTEIFEQRQNIVADVVRNVLTARPQGKLNKLKKYESGNGSDSTKY